MDRLLSRFEKIKRYPGHLFNLVLLARSPLFDADWYLANNLGIGRTKLQALLNYYRYGGFEGRDPGPMFSSNWYLNKYEDVKNAGINPLVHYLKYGQKEGRKADTQPAEREVAPYLCPVCKSIVQEFLPLSPFYEENKRKYGNPFSLDDVETINPTQYQCPKCGASDRDRLYALYLTKLLDTNPSTNHLTLLDIAPSQPLRKLLTRFPGIQYVSADKYMESVDLQIDIEDMTSIASSSFDFFICSHVLEHVNNDKSALAELFRILKPGCRGILMVPINLKIADIDEDPSVTDEGERWRRFGQYDHVRLYSKSGFLNRVQAAGFHVHQYGIEYFGRNVFSKHGISPGSILYVVEKKG